MLFLCYFILSGCSSSGDESAMNHRNEYGGFFYSDGSDGKVKEGYVYVSASGDTTELGDVIPKDVYPGLYKNKICYVFEHNLLYMSPTKLSPDTVLLHDQFLNASCFFEYDTLLVVMDLNKFDIVDMRNKQLVMASDLRVGNVTISENEVYVIADVNDYNEEPEYWILKGNIHEGILKRVKKFPEYPIANADCTTDGWNGMLVSHGVLFVKGQNNLFAIDLKNNSMLDKLSEGFVLKVSRNNATEVVFEFDGDEYVFSFSTKKFE